ncbi:MAG: SEL1-like repeat protein [Rhodobiaceae bacterium]|nr:SEL1-like repeat protein [Rhodobiaceae bacterium]MCC0055079.1 SEL1-like repeat protein [Rhodobiaceae bacterium]
MPSSAAWKPRRPSRSAFNEDDHSDGSLRQLLTRSLREMAGREEPGAYRRATSANRQLAGALRRHLHMLEASAHQPSGYYDDFDFDDYDDPRDRALEHLAEESRLTRQALFAMADRLEERLGGARSVPSPATPAEPAAELDPRETEIAALRAMLDMLEAQQAPASDEFAASDLASQAEPAFQAPASEASPIGHPSDERLARLEDRLNQIAEAIVAKTQAETGPTSGSQIEASIRRIADTQQAISHNIGETDERYRATLDERLNALASRIESKIQQENTQEAIGGLERELREMSDRLAQPDVDLGGLVSEVRSVADKIDAIPAHSESAFRRIASGLAEHIDSSSSATISTLRADIEKIHASAPAPDVSSIEHAIADIALRLDTAGQAELGALRDEIAQMRSEIHNSGRVDLTGIEGSLALLLQKLDERPAEPARADDTAVLAAVERRIAQLSEDIANVRAADATPSQIEPLLTDLARRIDASRADAVEAARQAAEAAAGKVMATPAGDPAPDKALIGALQSEIRQLRQSSDQSDRRTQDTLEAVHDVLGKIVDRLSDMERDVVASAPGMEPAKERKSAMAPALPPAETLIATAEPAMPAATERKTMPGAPTNTPAGETSPSLKDDVPLPPRMARHSEETVSAVEASASVEKNEDKTDFIAAARRAARAAAAEEAATANDLPKGLARLLRRKAKETDALAGDMGTATPAERKDPTPDRTKRVARGAEKAETVKDAPVSKRERIVAGAAETPANLVADVRSEETEKPAGSRKTIVYGMSIFLILMGSWQVYRMFTGPKTPPAPAAVSAPQQTAPATQTPPAATDSAPTGRQGEDTAAPDKQSSIGTQGTPRQIEIGQLPKVSDKVAATDGSALKSDDATATATVPPRLADLPTSLPLGLREAAAGGDMLARYEIGTRYAEARDVPQDLEKAAQWFELAAAQGHAPSQFRLGGMFEKGNGVPKDNELAKIWYERAAEKGNRRAMHNLAVLLADGSAGKPDYPVAADWFRRAAEFGLRDSQYNLGILYARGMGVGQDLKESYKWFSIAAAAGDTEAKGKADELARRMDPQSVAQAKIAANGWQAQPLDELANSTDTGEAPWNRETTASIPLDGPALIREAQQLLGQLGYDAGDPDGIAGQQTRNAVVAFQKEAGLTANGKIDPFLIDALRKQPR